MTQTEGDLRPRCIVFTCFQDGGLPTWLMARIEVVSGRQFLCLFLSSLNLKYWQWEVRFLLYSYQMLVRLNAVYGIVFFSIIVAAPIIFFRTNRCEMHSILIVFFDYFSLLPLKKSYQNVLPIRFKRLYRTPTHQPRVTSQSTSGSFWWNISLEAVLVTSKFFVYQYCVFRKVWRNHAWLAYSMETLRSKVTERVEIDSLFTLETCSQGLNYVRFTRNFKIL